MLKKLLKDIHYIILPLSMIAWLSSCIDPTTTANPKKVVLSMANALAKKYPNTPLIEVKDLLLLEKDILLVDVREKKEIDVSVIPGSMTQAQFEKNKDQYRNKTIVPYCTIGLRSTLYTNKLINEGFKAKNLKGGVLSFAHAGRKFIKDGKETTRVHVYSEAWNLVPKPYQGIFE